MRKRRTWRCGRTKGLVWAIALGVCLWQPAMSTDAADFLPAASERFAAAGTEETPDFRRHVVPLFGRLGCNGRACHGSFQGKGGFRLSLLGYDFKADHEALTQAAEPRVDAKHLADSLMLFKPTH